MISEKIKALIVEDNHDAAKFLEKYLKDFPEIEIVGTARNVDQASLAFLKHRPSLIFLDVELDDRTGFDFLENIRGISADFSVIFTTAFDHYAVEAIKHSAFDYLLKPVDPAELTSSLDRFRKKQKAGDFDLNLNNLHKRLNEAHHLKLTVRHGFIWQKTSEILYCEADWNYSYIYLTDGKKFLVTINMGKLEKMLPEKDFLRANRSMILNLQYLQRVDKEKGICVLKSGTCEISIPFPVLKIRKLERLLKERK